MLSHLKIFVLLQVLNQYKVEEFRMSMLFIVMLGVQIIVAILSGRF